MSGEDTFTDRGRAYRNLAGYIEELVLALSLVQRAGHQGRLTVSVGYQERLPLEDRRRLR